MPSRKPKSPSLKVFLDRLHRDYHRRRYLASDPLEFVHHYTDPWDQEAVALVAALLAYGNVKAVRRSVGEAILRMEGSPSAWVRGLADARGLRRANHRFETFVHRFNRGADVVALFRLLERSWKQFGSLGAHFVQGLQPEHEDCTLALSQLIGDWKRWAREDLRISGDSSFYYLLTSPEDGSCCKRWCMLLRWMGRSDAACGGSGQESADLDLGLWAEGGALSKTFGQSPVLRADQLVLPLDTHTGRISQYLGLTERRSLNWQAAVEITAKLKLCDPSDPTRYDFALSRLGILDICQRVYRPEVCAQCQLVSGCRFAQQAG